jgi:hypothetical protein
VALDPLATTADLTARKIPVPEADDDTITALLASASAAIRDAAGGPISRFTGTVELEGGCQEWLTFPLPIASIDSITINGTPVDGWKVRGGRLWRGRGWNAGYGNDFAITGIFGLAEVPEDIVDLTCSLVAAGLAAIEDGYDPKRGLMSLSIDDYREGYAKGDDEIINPMQLPERTREWLRLRFGGGTYVTRSV